MLRHLLAIFAAPLFAAAEKKDTVGGQALIEGVMMRGKGKVAWAVRRPDGEAVVESFPFVSITKRSAICGIPVIRGVINLFESLSWGYRALSRSADIASIEVEGVDDKASSAGSDNALSADNNAASAVMIEESSANEGVLSGDSGSESSTAKDSSSNISGDISTSSNNINPSSPQAADLKPTFVDRLLTTLSMVVAFAVSIGLFMYAPMWTVSRVPFINDSPMLFNLSAGAIRITLFLIYILLISLWSEMRRVFEYHGAEHRAIFAYEDGKPMTIENVEPYTTVHPRCGTSFLILVAICSILLFSVIDTLYIQYFGNFVNIFHRFVVHLILIPLVAGTSYEALKLSDKYQRLPLVGLLIKPGLWLQRITTRKPDRSQMEVAVKALEAAL